MFTIACILPCLRSKIVIVGNPASAWHDNINSMQWRTWMLAMACILTSLMACSLTSKLIQQIIVGNPTCVDHDGGQWETCINSFLLEQWHYQQATDLAVKVLVFALVITHSSISVFKFCCLLLLYNKPACKKKCLIPLHPILQTELAFPADMTEKGPVAEEHFKSTCADTLDMDQSFLPVVVVSKAMVGAQQTVQLFCCWSFCSTAKVLFMTICRHFLEKETVPQQIFSN